MVLNLRSLTVTQSYPSGPSRRQESTASALSRARCTRSSACPGPSRRNGGLSDCSVGTQVRHTGGCQNYGPLSGPLNTIYRSTLRTQKGTRILTTTHMQFCLRCCLRACKHHAGLSSHEPDPWSVSCVVSGPLGMLASTTAPLQPCHCRSLAMIYMFALTCR